MDLPPGARSASGRRSSPGGAEMAVYDVNGDGLNDVVTSLQAHGWGLSWFEQKKAADGTDQLRRAPDHGRLLDEERRRRDVLASSTARRSPTSTATAFRTSSPASGSGRTWTPSSIPIRTARRCCTSTARCATRRRLAARSSCPSWCTTARASARTCRARRSEQGRRRRRSSSSTKRGTFIFWNNWKKPAAISSR